MARWEIDGRTASVSFFLSDLRLGFLPCLYPEQSVAILSTSNSLAGGFRVWSVTPTTSWQHDDYLTGRPRGAPNDSSLCNQGC